MMHRRVISLAVAAVLVATVAAQATEVVATGHTSTVTGTTIFSDVPPDHSRADDIAHAVAMGWFLGYGDGTFRPSVMLSARQAATVFGRVFPDGISRADMAAFLRGNGPEPAGHRPTSTTATTVATTIPIALYGRWDYWADSETSVEGARLDAEPDDHEADWDPILWVFCDRDDPASAPGVLLSIPWPTSWTPFVAAYGFGTGGELTYDNWEKGSDASSLWPSTEFAQALVQTNKDVLFMVLAIDEAVGITFALDGIDQIRQKMSCF